MGFFSSTKKIIGHMIDFRVDRWIDFEHLKRFNVQLFKDIKQLFAIEKKPASEQAEDFEAAVARMDLSTDALQRQKKRYFALALFFMMLMLGLSGYGFCLILFYHNIIGSIISFALALYALSLAFKFHFWYFQISTQKLGCNFNDWFLSLLPYSKGKDL